MGGGGSYPRKGGGISPPSPDCGIGRSPWESFLADDRQADSGVWDGVLHDQEIGHDAIDTLVRALPEDAGDVGRLHELTIKHLLGALVPEAAITTDCGIGTQNECATKRNTLGVGLKDQRTDWVCVGDVGVRPRTCGGSRTDYLTYSVQGKGSCGGRGRHESLVDSEGVQATSIQPIGIVAIEAVLALIGTSEVHDQDVALGRRCREAIGVGEAIGVVREELEITSLDRRRRHGSTSVDVERCRGIVDGIAKEGLGVHRTSDCTITIVIERVKLADHMTVHIDIAAGEDRVLITTDACITQSLQVIRAILQGHEGFTESNRHETIDLVLAYLGDQSRACSEGLEALTCTDDAVHADGVSTGQGIAGRNLICINRVHCVALVDEHHLKALGLLATKPLAKLFGNTGLQLREECSLVFRTQVECGGVTEVIHLKGVITYAELFRVVSDDLVALDTITIETGHRAEHD